MYILLEQDNLTIKENSIFDASDELERGKSETNKNNFNTLNVYQKQDTDSPKWGMVSSIMQYLTTDKHDNVHKSINTDQSNFESDGANKSYIPLQSIHNDAVLFLRNQESFLMNIKLHDLKKVHQKYLENGDKRLTETRNQILNIFNELNQNCIALNEIYISEKLSKKDKCNLFQEWIIRKSSLNQKMSKIINESDEGKTYKMLLEKSDKIDDRIEKLEFELQILKNQQKLISQQISETKSLLDIKLNIYNNDIEILSSKENTEIELMNQEKQLTLKPSSDSIVFNDLQTQVKGIEHLIHITEKAKIKYEESATYLTDIFKTLKQMEDALYIFIKENKTEQLETILKHNREYLIQRLNEIKPLKLMEIESIIKNELSALEKAMVILNIPGSNFQHSPTPKYASSFDASNDSTEDYQNISSLDNISIVSSNKQTLQLLPNKIDKSSTAPPVTSVNVSLNNNNKSSKYGVDTTVSKYDQLINEIRNSKGDKTD